MKKFKLISILLALFLMFFISCEEENSDSNEVTNLVAEPEDSEVKLSWTKPTDDSYEILKITYSPDGETGVFVLKDSTNHLFKNLTNGIEYTFTVYTIDKHNKLSNGSTVSATPFLIDTIAPDDVENFVRKSFVDSVKLTWEEPSDTDFVGLNLYIEPGFENPIFIEKGVLEYTAENLSPFSEYTFTLKTLDRNSNESEGVSVNATPLINFAGKYKPIEGFYYKGNELIYTIEDWPTEVVITATNEINYKVEEYAGPFSGNTLHFAILDDEIAYGYQFVNGLQIAFCGGNTEMNNVCNLSNVNTVIIDNSQNKIQLVMAFGYSYNSVVREIYQVLEKIE